jgi:hypothetical protein
MLSIGNTLAEQFLWLATSKSHSPDGPSGLAGELKFVMRV